MKKKFIDVSLTVAFLIFITIPLAFIEKGNTSLNENRVLASFPNLFLSGNINLEFIREFDAWFSDHYGFRRHLVKLNSFINIEILKSSPSDKILIGKNNWLFYTYKQDGDPISNFQNANLYSKEQLIEFTNNLVQMKKWCKSHGSDFVFMIAPNKETIYEEYYPNGVRKLSNYSRLDQIVKFVNENSDIKVVDVRAGLFNAKAKEKLYYETDTHWNSYGAFIGYKELMNEINKSNLEIKPEQLKNFTITRQNRKGGDLAAMINMTDYFNDREYIFTRKEGNTFKYILSKFGPGGEVITETNNKSSPKAVMLRDSFTTAMVPFISNHFSRVVYDWSGVFNSKLIEKEKPDIVIYEVVERSMDAIINQSSIIN